MKRFTFIAAVFALAAPAAHASTASVSGTDLVITAAPGEANAVVGNSASYGYFYTDAAGITPGAGCELREANRVICTGYTRVVFSLGDGDDSGYTNEPVVLIADGGAGNDELSGGPHADQLAGGDGNDTINGGTGHDTIEGGAGDDILTGDGGDDTITGGAGRDRMKGDGETAYSNGNDSMLAADGEADTVDCSFGADTAEVDAADAVVECESVQTVGGGGGDGGGDGGGGDALAAALSGPKRLAISRFLSRGYRGTLEISQPGEVRLGLLVGKAAAKRAGLGNQPVLIASAVDQVPEAGAFSFTLKIKRKYRAKVAKLDRLKLTAALLLTNAAGEEKLVQRSLTLT